MTNRRSVNTYNYNKTLAEYMGNPWNYRTANGQEVGIEIEVEGENLPNGRYKGWSIHPDGSLRGESAEYVFNGPATREDAVERLQGFNKFMRDARVNQSYRTSVHVHLDFQQAPIKNIYNHILLYTIFEDVLADFCGKERVGNLFTLRARDAEYYLERLYRAVEGDRIEILNDNQIRYTAVNSVALFNHGTLEHRSMRGTVDIDLITMWMKILLGIKDVALGKLEHPKALVEMALEFPDQLIDMCFDKEAQYALTMDRFGRDVVRQGAKLVQHIAFCHDWVETPAKNSPKKAPTYAKYQDVARTAATNTQADLGQVWRFLNDAQAQRRAGDVPVRFTTPPPPPAAPDWIEDEEEL